MGVIRDDTKKKRGMKTFGRCNLVVKLSRTFASRTITTYSCICTFVTCVRACTRHSRNYWYINTTTS